VKKDSTFNFMQDTSSQEKEIVEEKVEPVIEVSSVDTPEVIEPPAVVVDEVVSAPLKGSSIEEEPAKAAHQAFRGGRGQGRGGARGGFGGGRGRGRGQETQVESDYEEKNIEIARVTRVTKGGKRMRFRALTVLGNRKGRVGFGLAKGIDVAGAISKAMTQARKALLTVPIVKDSIPFSVTAKFGAAQVLLKPAPKGTGIKAGGSVRIVLELAGVPNVSAKILGSNNKINNVKATFMALKKLKASTRVSLGSKEAEIEEANPTTQE
jgi:small subunit ribosomal protein S5